MTDKAGLFIGLFGILMGMVGMFFCLYCMGFFNYLGGKKKGHIAPVGKQELMMKLLALNDPSKPYCIMRGDESDLVAEWKIVDATWYGIFNKSRLTKAYRALLLVDETRCTVRCFEIFGSVSWTAGANGLMPLVHYSKSNFGGRILFKKSWGVGYAIKDWRTLEVGKVYEYQFDVDDIKVPIAKTVTDSGWEWVQVVAKRHATYKK